MVKPVIARFRGRESDSMNKMSLLPETDEQFAAWCQRREREGPRVDLLDLYAIVAAARGVSPEALPLIERQVLAQRALGVILSLIHI